MFPEELTEFITETPGDDRGLGAALGLVPEGKGLHAKTRAGLGEGRARWRSLWVKVVGDPQETRIGVTPQISSAYWRIVRSLENLPMWATFRIAFRVQADASR